MNLSLCRKVFPASLLIAVLFTAFAFSQDNLNSSSTIEIVRLDQEYSKAHLEPAMVEGEKMIAVVFEGSRDMHYYASEETAIGGLNLKIAGKAESAEFGSPIFPPAKKFYDKAQEKDIDAYYGDFAVFVPIMSIAEGVETLDLEVVIEGIACTSQVCLRPFEYSLAMQVEVNNADVWKKMEIAKAVESAKADEDSSEVVSEGFTTAIFYMVMALVAGFSFNIMPCVLPVIPIIVQRLLSQSHESRPRSVALGMGFCGGIVMFFLAFAVLSIIFQLITGTVFQWGDHLRYPWVVAVMFLVVLIFAMFMFDIFTIGIPSSVASKSGSGHGMAGSVSMGFLAGLLSTPCSGAILAFVLLWVQTQTSVVAVLTFLLMGIGMALPFAFLVAYPALLSKMPRPGEWMDIFRKSMGFVLLIIAVKLFGSLPHDMSKSVLYFAVVLSFAVWMSGKWVSFTTPTRRKLVIRGIALLLSVAAGLFLFIKPAKLVDWKAYDASIVEQAVSSGRPVIIKFTAEWCTNCAVVDKKVYQDPQVAAKVKQKNVLMVLGDTTTKDYAATIDLKEVYGEPGSVPISIYIDPQGKEHKLRGIFKKDDLLELLDKIE